MTEEEDDDDDGDSSVVSADNVDRLTDDECSTVPVADTDTNCLDNSYPQTPPELANLDSSNGSLDP